MMSSGPPWELGQASQLEGAERFRTVFDKFLTSWAIYPEMPLEDRQ